MDINRLPNIFHLFWPSIRRRYLYYFQRKYVEKMIAARQGSCQGCGGVCCQRTRRCPFLKGSDCSLYDSPVIRFCRIFPIDPDDIRLSGVADVCQFHWDEQEKATGGAPQRGESG